MSDSGNDSRWSSKLTSITKETTATISAVLAVIAACLSIFYGWQNYKSQSAASEVEGKLKAATAEADSQSKELSEKLVQVHSAIEQSQEDRQRIMTVYNEVISAIHDPDSHRKDLAAQLVVFYLKPASTSDSDTPLPEDRFRAKMLDMLGENATPDEKVVVEQAKFDLQNQVAALGNIAPTSAGTPVASSKSDQLKGSRVDIFWCERSGDRASSAATALSGVLSTKTSGLVRVREFPIALMRNSYLKIPPAEIRREPGEAALGGVLQNLSAKSLTDSGIVSSADEIKFKWVRDPTPGYLSLFICP